MSEADSDGAKGTRSERATDMGEEESERVTLRALLQVPDFHRSQTFSPKHQSQHVSVTPFLRTVIRGHSHEMTGVMRERGASASETGAYQ